MTEPSHEPESRRAAAAEHRDPRARRCGGRGAAMPDPRTQGGIAVLLVLACLAVLAPFTVSFGYQARVDFQSAVNVRDEVSARQIQRGALQLSLLLFEIQRRVFNQRQFRDFMGSMDITQVAPYLMSVFGTDDGAEGLGAFVGIDTSALKDLALEEGSFEYRVYAEGGKINVNCLANQPAGGGQNNNPAGRTTEILEALIVPTIYDPLFEEEKSDGQFYTRTQVLEAIADYIDDDDRVWDIIRFQPKGMPETYRYQQLFDPYLPRNAPLDSIEEMHLIEGIDDDFMAAFGDQLSVYGECKVNLNFATAEQIALVIRHSVKEEDQWKTEGENFLTMTMPLANYVVEYREFNLFTKLEDFQKLVEKPDQFINPLSLLGGSVEDARSQRRVPDGILIWQQGKPGKDGEAPVAGLDEVATVKPETVYTVEVVTTVGTVTKRLTAVFDMQYTRSFSEGPSRKGAWLHLRED
jgi:hypothetical protein